MEVHYIAPIETSAYPCYHLQYSNAADRVIHHDMIEGLNQYYVEFSPAGTTYITQMTLTKDTILNFGMNVIDLGIEIPLEVDVNDISFDLLYDGPRYVMFPEAKIASIGNRLVLGIKIVPMPDAPYIPILDPIESGHTIELSHPKGFLYVS